MEVCVDSFESALNALKAGASRIELCSALCLGGLTPSVGLLQTVKKNITIPVFVMIRPRAGDFLYSEDEVKVMKADISLLKQFGADGFVFGILTSDGKVDKKACVELIDVCRPLPVTFHRALDVACDIFAALEDVISVGFDRVLTSGGHLTAPSGVSVIKRLVEQSDERIIVMPGAGISETNLRELLEETGAKEFHGSASKEYSSSMNCHSSLSFTSAAVNNVSESRMICDVDKVRTMLQIFNTYIKT